jgi:hypothetical protein
MTRRSCPAIANTIDANARKLPTLLPQRSWSNNLICPTQEDIPPSPKWSHPIHRKPSCRLTYDEDDRQVTKETTAGTVDDEEELTRKGSKDFSDTAKKLTNLVGMTCVRMQDYLKIIHERMEKDPDMFKNESHMDRFVSLTYLEAVVIYRLTKWLHQLEPRVVAKPTVPEKPEDPTATNLLAAAKFSLSRMQMLASTLALRLQKIVSDAKNQRPTVNGRPVSPSLLDPVSLAHRRGIVDVQAFDGVGLHLEHILQTAEGLAHNPAPAQKVAVAIKVMMAANRFKGLRLTKEGEPPEPRVESKASSHGDP